MMDARRKAYLQAIGIDLWTVNPVVSEANAAELVTLESVSFEKNTQQSVTDISAVEAVEAVELIMPLEETIPIEMNPHVSGNSEAEVFVVSTETELSAEQQRLLAAMFAAIQLPLDQLYKISFTDIAELVQAETFLSEKLAQVKPQVIYVFGADLANALLQLEESMETLRAGNYHYKEIPVMVSYGAQHLLAKPEDKALAWQDLQILHGHLNKS